MTLSKQFEVEFDKTKLKQCHHSNVLLTYSVKCGSIQVKTVSQGQLFEKHLKDYSFYTPHQI